MARLVDKDSGTYRDHTLESELSPATASWPSNVLFNRDAWLGVESKTIASSPSAAKIRWSDFHTDVGMPLAPPNRYSGGALV